MSDQATQNPIALLQRLVRFDTTNPPGDESACIAYIREILHCAGIATQILAQSPDRPNLLARLPGEGKAPPLLLYGHVDVVRAESQSWKHPPFGGLLADGYVWGRGTLDMKGGVAMMLAALLRARAEAAPLPGDVILAILSDEEAGGDAGARFLVENHPGQFQGVQYAIGEFGGFSVHLGGRKFYPIQVAEKQLCWMKAIVRGPGGHGSMPVRGSAMTKLAHLLKTLDQKRLPVHVTPAARVMIGEMASALGGMRGALLRLTLIPPLTNLVLGLLGKHGRFFDPLLHNTVCPTVLQSSQKVNVIPGEISVELDGRLLSGCEPADLIEELQRLLGNGVELELIRYDPGPPAPDMGWFETLAGILREADSEGIPVPLLLAGFTDARFFARLGIQTYGFLPMSLPADFKFTETIHAADERIPVDALEFGTRAILKALGRSASAGNP